MKRESFIKSFMTIGIATVINLAVGFITTPIITRIVEPYEYGQFSIFTMYTSLALMILTFGLDQSFVRFFYVADEIEYKRKLIAEVTLIPLVGTIIFLAFALFLVINRIITLKFGVICSVLLAFNILFAVLYRFSSLLLRLNNSNRVYAVTQVLHKVCYVVIAIVLLVPFKIGGIISLSLAIVITTAICYIVPLLYSREYIPRINDYKKISKIEELQLLKYGLPFILSAGITTVFQSLDKLALDYYRSYSEVGVYSSAMTFVTLFSVIHTSFNVIWAPRSVEHYENAPNDKSFFDKAFNLMTVIMFSFGIALIMFKDLFALLLGEKYREAAYIMPFLMFYPIMYTVSEITVCGVDFMKKSTLHIIIAACACVTNFIGNNLLVPNIGCKGAAISTGVSYIVFFVLRTVLGEHYYYVGFSKIRFFIITLVCLVYALLNTFLEFGLWSIIAAIVCYTVIFCCYKKTIVWACKYITYRIGNWVKCK